MATWSWSKWIWRTSFCSASEPGPLQITSAGRPCCTKGLMICTEVGGRGGTRLAEGQLDEPEAGAVGLLRVSGLVAEAARAANKASDRGGMSRRSLLAIHSGIGTRKMASCLAKRAYKSSIGAWTSAPLPFIHSCTLCCVPGGMNVCYLIACKGQGGTGSSVAGTWHCFQDLYHCLPFPFVNADRLSSSSSSSSSSLLFPLSNLKSKM